MIYLYLFSGLAFRGGCDKSIKNVEFDFNDNKNYFKVESEGYFMGLVKLVASLNPILSTHIQKCKESQKISYLSDTFV